MSIGSFILVRNEIAWIEAHIANVAPHLDECVFFDGNSTDGTLEILRAAAAKYPSVRLFEGKDPADLRGAYAAMFDECLKTLRTDIAVFLHPDMWVENPERLRGLNPNVAGSMRVLSYAGEPGGQLHRINGRAEEWKNVYRLRNPDLGAHYYGHYGAWNEDVYFSEITGDSHVLYRSLADYPYNVESTGITIHHFSDVRPFERRLGRMKTCLLNQGIASEEAAAKLALIHPRVTLKDGDGHTFTPAEYPEGMRAYMRGGVHA